MEYAVTATERLYTHIEAYGYWVSMEPIPGEEVLFEQSLREAVTEIERVFAFVGKSYGTRGRSKRALEILHSYLPEPVWGVEVHP